MKEHSFYGQSLDSRGNSGSQLNHQTSFGFTLLGLIVAISFVCVESLSARSPQLPPIEQLDAPFGGSTSDRFGQSISMNTQFGAIGTPGLNVTVGGVVHLAQGGVHIYTTPGGGIYNYDLTLTPSNGTANDNCGLSVSTSSQWVVAGLPGRNIVTSSIPPNQLQAGVVCAWRLGPSGWETPPHQLQHPDPKSIDLFGSSVAVGEQIVDGEIRTTIVVGAPGDNISTIGSDCGSVCVFEWNKLLLQWEQTAFISPPILGGESAVDSAYGFFGSSVAIFGDYIVIGAKRQTVSVNKQGTAFVFRRNTIANPAPTILQTNVAWGDWALVQRITASIPSIDEAFGTSVSISQWDLVVGAPGGSVAPGSASIYDLDDILGKFVLNAQVFALFGNDGDQFGLSVVLKSDVLLVGAPGVDVGVAPNQIANRGLVYLFKRDAQSCQGWSPGISYSPPSSQNIAEAGFGTSIDLASQDVAISASKGNNQQLGQGVVLIYELNTIACPGDINGDGGVTGEDIVLLFSHWGGCAPENAIADLNNDGCVNGADLTYAFQAWGPCICGG